MTVALMSETHCTLCDRIAAGSRGQLPSLIHQFPNSLLVVGDHQFHRGYCVLIYKEHVREMHDLPVPIQREVFTELMTATKAIAKAFKPWKMNHACYGNQVPHIHWHIFPRYDTEPDHLDPPFLHSAEFGKYATTEEAARALAERVRENL
jgi:diadenosine tetraphosphate (Ap4A) HIT family hydrolase